MICWMFPGQPLKFAATPTDDACFLQIAAACRTRTGLDLMSSLPVAKGMSLHTSLQIHGVTMSLWRAESLLNSGVAPDIIAQHSMGIYPALATSGVISTVDALDMACRGGACMAKVFCKREYALGCVIGMVYEKLQPIVSSHGVYFANYNTSRHFLITGLKKDVQTALDAAAAAGAFSVSIHQCDAPLHSPLMAEAEDDLLQIFADFSYSEPKIPLMSHLGELLDDPALICDFLYEELLTPVFWDKSWHALRQLGVDEFIEVGSGDTLKKFNRWIASENPTL